MITIRITGPQGAGKTKLARQIEALLQHQHKVVKVYDEGSAAPGNVERVDVVIEIINTGGLHE